MIKSHRRPVHKGKSSAHFRHSISKTHPKNVKVRPMRGGWRL